MSIGAFASYKLEVKWNGSDWVDESAYRKSTTIKRGRTGGTLSQADVGGMSLVLDNSSKRFLPEYSAGPLYGNLKPGKEVRLRANYGRCVSLNGTDQYLAMATDDPSFKITSQITVGAWVYATAAALAGSYIMGKGGAWRLSIADFGDSTYLATFSPSLEGASASATAWGYTLNAWHHVVGVYNGAAVSIYTDGVGYAVGATGAIVNTAYPVTVGDWYAGFGQLFTGKIAYPFIFDRALSANEIKALYNHGAARMYFDANLRGWWPFWDQTPDDESGNGHDLTAYGSPTYPLTTDLYDTTLFVGKTDEFRPETSQEQITISCVQQEAMLEQFTPDLALQTNKTTGELVDAVLTAAGVSATDRLIDDGASVIPVAVLKGKNALELCRDIATVERGLFYLDAANMPVFEDRNKRRRAPCTTATVTVDDATDISGNVEYSLSPKDVRNVIRVTCHPLTIQGVEVVGSWGGAPIYLANGETRTIELKFRDVTTGKECLAADIETLTTPTDYTANAQSDGGGADRSANLSIVKTEYADKVSLACTASANLYITKLSVRGKPYESYDAAVIVQEDTTSQAAYGKRALEFDSELLQDEDDAQQIAVMLKNTFNDPEGECALTLYGHKNAALQRAVMRLQISDRVDITHAKTGLSGKPYFVEAIDLSIGHGDAPHTAVYTLSPVVAEGYWIADVSEFDDETVPAF